MILPNMTPDEIRRLMLLELEDMQKRCLKTYSNIRRDVIKKKLKHKHVVYFNKFTSPNKTKWLARTEKFKGDKYQVTSYYGCFFREKRGFRYVEIGIADHNLEIYNAHFMHRYVERMHLSLTDPLEIIKDFFVKNTSISSFYPSEQTDNPVYRVYCPVPEGIKLGTYDSIQEVLVWNTFISENEFKGEQKELRQIMKDLILKERAEQPNLVRNRDEIEYMNRLVEAADA